MSLTVISYPQSTFSDGHVSRVSAGYNPIALKIRRQDMVILSAEAGSPISVAGEIITTTKINIESFTVPAGFSEVYVDATFGGVSLIRGIYDRAGETNIGSAVITSFEIVLDWNSSYSDINGGFANLVLGQKIEAIVYPKVKDTQIYTVAPASFSFLKDGTCTIYLNSLFEDYFSQRINTEDRYVIGQTLSIELEIYQSIQGLDESSTADLTISFSDGFYAVKSVRQIGEDKFMSDYVIYKTGGNTSTGKKFLTAMEKPIRFGSLPFALYALIDDVSEATQINRIVNGVSTNIAASEFETTGIYQFIVDGDTQLKADDIDNLTELLEIQQIEYCDLDDNVYLRWENNLGGFDYYLFKGNVSENFRSGTNTMFEPFIEDTENATSNFKVLEKRFQENIRAFANFDKANKESFKQLAYSKHVEMYDGATWWQVDIDINRFTLSSNNSYGKLAISVMLPKTYLK